MEIARQRCAEQARLAKLEEQRVEYLDRKLAQAEPRDRLRTFLTTLPLTPSPRKRLPFMLSSNGPDRG
ncbi:hypothetical protein [Mesorhizobium sp.]|uniref:hypothetical protein n=1 Tax=Mesorhizobium sp. TaxID=1871066 RepID=UPI000FE8D8CB|nr:hypothetical protein [Mesorhizobium sp.]RWP51140.1 MAG: hypothetical protein EOR05_04275 [Mesorhizobium sp.]